MLRECMETAIGALEIFPHIGSKWPSSSISCSRKGRSPLQTKRKKRWAYTSIFVYACVCVCVCVWNIPCAPFSVRPYEPGVRWTIYTTAFAHQPRTHLYDYVLYTIEYTVQSAAPFPFITNPQNARHTSHIHTNSNVAVLDERIAIFAPGGGCGGALF